MLQDTIREEMKKAMIAKDANRVQTMRSLMSAFTNELVSLKRKPSDALSNDEAMAVIKRAVKQRKDSIEQFRAGNREDLAAAEEAELAILEPLLPKQASKEEVMRAAEAVKARLGVVDKSKMGQLIGAVMKEFKGNADGADVKEAVESLFK